jgi:hypothetical protein
VHMREKCPRGETEDHDSSGGFPVHPATNAMSVMGADRREALCKSADDKVKVNGCNMLETIDVSGAAYVHILDCSSLYSITGTSGPRSTLKVSGCDSLKSLPNLNGCDLVVWDCDSVTEIDVSGASSLVVENCVSLERIFGDASSLTWLDVQACPSLVSLPHLGSTDGCKVRIGSCGGLTSLDASGVASLDVHGCAGLKRIHGVASSLCNLDMFNCGSLESIPSFGFERPEDTRVNVRALFCKSLSEPDMTGVHTATLIMCGREALGTGRCRTTPRRDVSRLPFAIEKQPTGP